MSLSWPFVLGTDSIYDSRVLEHQREIVQESQHLLTSPQMHNNGYAINNIYSSQVNECTFISVIKQHKNYRMIMILIKNRCHCTQDTSISTQSLPEDARRSVHELQESTDLGLGAMVCLPARPVLKGSLSIEVSHFTWAPSPRWTQPKSVVGSKGGWL